MEFVHPPFNAHAPPAFEAETQTVSISSENKAAVRLQPRAGRLPQPPGRARFCV